MPLVSAAAESQPKAAPETPGTIGLVLTDWRYALYETPDAKEECPAGLQAGEVQQYRGLPDPAGHLKKIGGQFDLRGEDGENANYNPLSIEDPLPWKDLQTKVGYGANLDGTADGHGTSKTCPHEKFTSPEGEQIDNQMARVVGCVQGWRKSGFSAEFYSNEVVTSPINRHLIEITGVADETNDSDVEVAIYKGRDRLVRTAAGTTFVPFMSHRIDERYPQYMYRTHGKIVNGTLITDPIPVAHFPIIQIQMVGDRELHNLTLRLKLNENGAEGYLAGYEPLTTWWNIESKSPASDVGKYSPSGLYRAFTRYADGDRDSATGKCTAISVAYKVTAVRALIVHTPKSQNHVAEHQTAKAPRRVAMGPE
jgi:hypothetical protein